MKIIDFIYLFYRYYKKKEKEYIKIGILKYI